MRKLPSQDALGLLLATLVAMPALLYPFGNDQALHWYIGRRWLDGELPFVSAISSKPIGIFLTHALATGLMGDGMWPVRVLELCTLLLTAVLITRLIRAAEPGSLGAAALLLTTTYYAFFDYWDTAHPELWEGSLLLAGLTVAASNTRPWLRDISSAALVMGAFMFKFPAALPGLAILLLCLVRTVREPSGDAKLTGAVLCAARMALGGALVLALCISPFALAGQLAPMWEVLHDFISHYADQARHDPSASTWQQLDRGGSLLLATLAATLCVLVTAFLRRDWTTLERTCWLTGSTALALASVVVQGRYFGYHFVVLTPLCVALLLLAWRTLAPRLVGYPAVLSAATLATCLLAAGPRWERPREHSYARHAAAAFDHARGQTSRSTYLKPFQGRAKLDDFGLMERVARRVERVSKPGDTLCARGFATPLYPLTGLRCTSRHIVQEIVPNGLPHWPAEYRRALEQRPPTFLVTFTDRKQDLAYLRRQGYRLLATEGKFALLTKRKDGQRAALP